MPANNNNNNNNNNNTSLNLFCSHPECTSRPPYHSYLTLENHITACHPLSLTHLPSISESHLQTETSQQQSIPPPVPYINVCQQTNRQSADSLQSPEEHSNLVNRGTRLSKRLRTNRIRQAEAATTGHWPEPFSDLRPGDDLSVSDKSNASTNIHPSSANPPARTGTLPLYLTRMDNPGEEDPAIYPFDEEPKPPFHGEDDPLPESLPVADGDFESQDAIARMRRKLNVDILVSGHSHDNQVEVHDGYYHINPVRQSHLLHHTFCPARTLFVS